MSSSDSAATDGPVFYRHLTFNAPLSGQRADAIVGRLAASAPADVTDIGCGWGELLLRVLEAVPGARGVGIDIDDSALRRGREAAVERGVDGRVVFKAEPGESAAGEADLVICVGSSHAFGDLGQALHALRPLVRPGGRLLFGEAYWDAHAPGDRSLVWDDVLALPDLAGMVDAAVDAGYRPLYIEASSQDELDAFESGFLADYEEWLMTSSAHPDAATVRARADEHRRRWLHGYRAGFGFAYLTLGVPA